MGVPLLLLAPPLLPQLFKACFRSGVLPCRTRRRSYSRRRPSPSSCLCACVVRLAGGGARGSGCSEAGQDCPRRIPAHPRALQQAKVGKEWLLCLNISFPGAVSHVGSVVLCPPPPFFLPRSCLGQKMLLFVALSSCSSACLLWARFTLTPHPPGARLAAFARSSKTCTWVPRRLQLRHLRPSVRRRRQRFPKPCRHTPR